MMANIA